ncbi:MAG: mannosyltransferase family protein [Candidatus Woesebacteria bacterium]
MTKRIVLKLFFLFIIWHIGVFSLSYFADRFLPYKPSFSLIDLTLIPSGLPRSIYSFGNFDGVHYITIARDGYNHVEGIQAFFPLFPRIVLGVFHDFFGRSTELLAIGLILSNLFFFGFLCLLFTFIQEKFNPKTAWGAVITVLIFPTSFFFGALYTESLFMLLVIGSFYAAHRKKWRLAGVLAAFASCTRVVGIFLVPALLIELWSHKEQRSAKNVLAILIGCAGLLAYMAYLWTSFGDPLLFAHVQSGFGAGRSTTIVLYPQVLWRSLKILLTSPRNIAYVTYIQEFAAGTLGLILLLLAYKRVPKSWTVFALLCFFFPPLTGTFSSMSRYLLVCFPIYILGGWLYAKYPKAIYLLWAISFFLLCVNTILFIQGYWVA